MTFFLSSEVSAAHDKKEQTDGSFATFSRVVLVGLSLELQSTTASTAGELSPTMSRVEHLCRCEKGIDGHVTGVMVQ